MNKVILACLLVLAPALVIRAQPSPPAVIFPSDNISWTVDISSHETGQPETKDATARPKRMKIEAKRTGDVSCYRTTWSNQRITEDWLTKDVIFWQDVISGRISVVPKGGSILEYQAYDQSRFDWVAKSEAVSERENFKGKTCIHVRRLIEEIQIPDEKPRPPSYLQAWIDAQTHMPVAFDDRQDLYTYTFHPPFTEPLALPQQYQDELARYIKARTAPKRLGY